jgi:hypothetical protein
MLIYGLASFLHFTHNAVFLRDYPNMPPGLTSGGVYLAFAIVVGVGVLGYRLVRSGYRRLGRTVIALYALLGFAGLDHYCRCADKRTFDGMHATIAAEVAMAAILMVSVVGSLGPDPLPATGPAAPLSPGAVAVRPAMSRRRSSGLHREWTRRVPGESGSKGPRHGRIAALHLRHARLARTKQLGQSSLAHPPLMSAMPEAIGQP